ncbi:MAG: hypothetical protein B7Z37_07910 [Verrucomicrobia bacterium 12-59-8]|nr:MAG: hypothetical protein B7Z37_07910 [Verrucomicrobia bacterium 12-59-8]
MPRLIKWSSLLVLLLAAAAWWVQRPGPVQEIYRASRREMMVLEPEFLLSLKELPDCQVNHALVAQAVGDAKAMGEECAFYCALACPETGRVMYVLTVLQRTDTELIYAGSVDGKRLVAKAYWSGYGGWSD